MANTSRSSQKNDNPDNNNHNGNNIHSTSTVWLSGKNKRPTIFLPTKLAQKFRMDKPCTIAFIDTDDGILLQFLHLKNE